MRQHPDFSNLFVCDHPLVLHKLSHMRDKSCDRIRFKCLLNEIAQLMAYEITRPLPLATRRIETPIQAMDAPFLQKPTPVIVPILRAGLGMADGLEMLIPDARIGHIGLYRDEETKEPVEYLIKLPDLKEAMVFLVDPMLATGHSAKYALDVLVREGGDPANIRFMVLVAAPEGVQVLREAYPDIPVFTAALDEKLNDDAFIVPGLGDAGDRLFGTV